MEFTDFLSGSDTFDQNAWIRNGMLVYQMPPIPLIVTPTIFPEEEQMHGDNITMDFGTKHLIEVLKKNRNQHSLDIKNAETGYHKAYKAVLKKRIDNMQKHLDDPEKTDLKHFQMPEKPFGYVHKYDRMIAMLEATTNQTLPLSAQQFQCYAMDEWEEKRSFTAVSGAISAYYQ